MNPVVFGLPLDGGLELAMLKFDWELIPSNGGGYGLSIGFKEFPVDGPGEIEYPPFWDWAANYVRKASVVVNALHYNFESEGTTKEGTSFAALADILMWNYRLATLARAYRKPYVMLSSGRVYESTTPNRECVPVKAPPIDDEAIVFWQAEKDAIVHGGFVARVPELFGPQLHGPIAEAREQEPVTTRSGRQVQGRVALDARSISLASVDAVALQLNWLALDLSGLEAENSFLGRHRYMNLGTVGRLDDVGSWMDAILLALPDIPKDHLNLYNHGARSYRFTPCSRLTTTSEMSLSDYISTLA